MELRDQIAVVTGAARGIGAAIAEELARAGAVVHLVDLLEGELLEAARRMEEEGLRVRPEPGIDVTDPEACRRVVQEASRGEGGLRILVNNAGITRDGLLARMKEEDWERVLRVDLTAPFLWTRAAARTMMRARRGKVINIGSIAGRGNAGQANYSAAKAGLVGLTKTAALELAPFGVQVNAVAPGLIDSEMTRSLPEKAVQAIQARIPLGRPGSPADVARAVRFLAGPGADYVTGTVLDVSGGLGI